MKKHARTLLLALCGLFSVSVGGAQSAGEFAPISQCLADGRVADALVLVDQQLAERASDLELLECRFTLLLALEQLDAAVAAGESWCELAPDGLKKDSVRALVDALRRTVDASAEAKESAAGATIAALLGELALARKERNSVLFDKALRGAPKAFASHPVLLLARAESSGSLGSKFNGPEAQRCLEKLLTALEGDLEPDCLPMFDILVGRNGSDLADFRRVAADHQAALQSGRELFVLTPTKAIEREQRNLENQIEARESTKAKNVKELAEARKVQRQGDKRHSDVVNESIREFEKRIEESNSALKSLRERRDMLKRALEDRGD